LDHRAQSTAGYNKALAQSGVLPLSLFEERNLAEITNPAYPAERLIVCRNPLVGAECGRKRQALLDATEAELNRIAVRVAAGTLQGQDHIGVAVGLVVNRSKMEKHFDLQIEGRRFAFPRKSDGYQASHRAVRELRAEDRRLRVVTVRSCQYLNNIVEQDHRGVKRRLRPMLGLKYDGHAAITIAASSCCIGFARISLRSVDCAFVAGRHRKSGTPCSPPEELAFRQDLAGPKNSKLQQNPCARFAWNAGSTLPALGIRKCRFGASTSSKNELGMAS
jgi:hypothetical protein